MNLVADIDEYERLVGVVREFVRDRVAYSPGDRQESAPESVLECPRCGDRIIVLDRPATYAMDEGHRVCKACRAEHDLSRLAFPDSDIGGEGA